MLILSRKVGETIRINSDIAVTVVGIQQGQVRIGIEAPAHVSVDRQEIFERKAASAQVKAVARA